MRCLLYGIVFARAADPGFGHSPSALPPGVGGAAVKLLEERGLRAAISSIGPPDLTPSIARVLAHWRVVEALHGDRAVLPMRYGCLFEEEPRVVELLRVHGAEYATILRGLDGCVEMGVRVLLPTGSSSPRSQSDSGIEEVSGHAYLTGRTARYAREDAAAGAAAVVMAGLRAGLGALAERTRTDSGVMAEGGPASIYFLVKRTAVESFRRKFREVEHAEPARLLLSGPWPPYNFVAPDQPGHGHA